MSLCTQSVSMLRWSYPCCSLYLGAGVCPTGYDLHTTSSSLCDRCAFGFQGTGCSMCSNDFGCQVGAWVDSGDMAR
jgi:hypothetical protein